MIYKTERGESKIQTLVCTCGATARNNSKERGRFFRRHPVEPTATHFVNLAKKAQLRLDRLEYLHSKLLGLKSFGPDYAKEVSASEQAIGAQRLVLEKLNYRARLANAN